MICGSVSLLLSVVLNLDNEDDNGRNGRDEVGDDKRPIIYHEALYHKENTSETEQKEGGHRDSVGVTGTDRVDCLRKITA